MAKWVLMQSIRETSSDSLIIPDAYISGNSMNLDEYVNDQISGYSGLSIISWYSGYSGKSWYSGTSWYSGISWYSGSNGITYISWASGLSLVDDQYLWITISWVDYKIWLVV